jgi:starvation-inducible DNA-binding protein
MTEHTLSQDHHPTLRHPDRQAIGAALQSALVVLTDLALAGKHAHWNVTGPHFHTLHRQLDEMVDAWRDAGDAVAERAVALGHPVDCRAALVAQRSELPQLGDGPLRDHEVVTALTAILTEAVAQLRRDMDHADALDVVTGDLLHTVVGTLEQQLWMVRVQAD